MLYFEFKKKGFTGDFSRVSEHVVQVTGGVPETGGFMVYRDESKDYFIGDYSDYKTIYRKDANQLSNDGSTYVPPEPPPAPTPTESKIEVNGVEYSVYDVSNYGDISFLMRDTTAAEAQAIFQDVTSMKINGVEYDNLVFTSASEIQKYDQEYAEVFIHVKTEIDLLREEIEATRINIADNFNSAKTYSVDEYCIYQNNLYKFIEKSGKGIVPTNKMYWTLCDVATELNKLSALVKEN